MLTKSIAEGRKENGEAEETWQRKNRLLKNIAKNEVECYKGKRAKKPWVTNEIIQKIEEKRQYKNKNAENSIV